MYSTVKPLAAQWLGIYLSSERKGCTALRNMLIGMNEEGMKGAREVASSSRTLRRIG